MQGCYQNYQSCLGGILGCLRSYLPVPFCFCPYPWRNINSGTVGVKKSFGKFKEMLKPGLHYFNPCSQSVQVVSLRSHLLQMRHQKIFTNDNIAVNIDTVVFYRIVDPEKALFQVSNTAQSVLEVSYATLRSIAGQFNLKQLLENRDKLTRAFMEHIQKEVITWGVKIDHLLIRDMSLNREIQNNLSIAAITKRKVQSKIISAQADIKAARMMKQAADILNSKAAIQIRYLNSINSSEGEGGRWILLPLNFQSLADNL